MPESAAQKPQPGAVPGDFKSKSNGMPLPQPKGSGATLVCPPGWQELPASEYGNFVDAKPQEITFYSKQSPNSFVSLLPYRVWGARWTKYQAWDIGRYWTYGVPASEAEFYGKCAVQFDWNSADYICQLNNPGAETIVKAWVGTVACQPACGVDANGQPGDVIDGYYLPGGWTQIYFPDGSLPFLSNRATGWSASHARAMALAAAPRPSAAPQIAPADVDPARYARLNAAVTALSALLDALDQPSLTPGGGQAEVLLRRMRSFYRDISLGTPGGRERARLALWSLTSAGRLVDRIVPDDMTSQYNNAVEEVVLAAHDLATTMP